MLYVISRALGKGNKAGLVSSLGIGAGTMVHLLLAVLGISALLKVSIVAFTILKIAGAGYLIYLGIQGFRKSDNSLFVKQETDENYSRMFWQAAMTNILNPKVAIFFITFLPQFVNPENGNVSLQITTLGLIFNLSGITVLIVLSMFSGTFSEKLKNNSLWQKIQKWFTSSILILLGIRLAFQSQD